MPGRSFRKLRDFVRNRTGSILIETAFIIPLLTTITLSGVELSRYVLVHQKMERIAASVADLASQSQTLSQADIDNIMAAVEHIAKPFDMTNDGVVIISDVGATGGNPATVNWQEIGAGNYAAPSEIGGAGDPATLPTGFMIADDDDVIIAEVIYNYTPWILGGVTGPAEIYQRSIYRPRLGPLTTPPT